MWQNYGYSYPRLLSTNGGRLSNLAKVIPLHHAQQKSVSLWDSLLNPWELDWKIQISSCLKIHQIWRKCVFMWSLLRLIAESFAKWWGLEHSIKFLYSRQTVTMIMWSNCVRLCWKNNLLMSNACDYWKMHIFNSVVHHHLDTAYLASLYR